MYVQTHRCHIHCDVLITRVMLCSVKCRLLLYILAPQWIHVSYNHCTAAAEITFPWDFFFNLFVGGKEGCKMAVIFYWKMVLNEDSL
jgi:hypothetical protein